MKYRWKKEVWDPFFREGADNPVYVLEDDWGAEMFNVFEYDDVCVVAAMAHDDEDREFPTLEDAVAYCEGMVRLMGEE